MAFTVAATAIAAGTDVSMWLTGGATLFAMPGVAEKCDTAKATPLAELRDMVVAGGRLTACTQCLARRELEHADLIDGVRVAGAASFVEEVLAPDTQALVY